MQNMDFWHRLAVFCIFCILRMILMHIFCIFCLSIEFIFLHILAYFMCTF